MTSLIHRMAMAGLSAGIMAISPAAMADEHETNDHTHEKESELVHKATHEGDNEEKAGENPLSQAIAMVKNREGGELGQVMLIEGPRGTLAKIHLSNIPAGWHAIHLHESGDCSADDFTSASGHAIAMDEADHYGKEHGFLSGHVQHAGDMPNIWAGEDGIVKVHYYLEGLALEQVLDEDGASVIVHEGADDYVSQPSGAAGPRIACGVVDEMKADD